MKHRYQTCVRTLLCAWLAAGAAAAQSGPARLHGRVTDPSDAVIPGAIVQIKGPVVARQTTSELGEYSFNGIPAGKYTVGVGVRGFVPFETLDFEVAGDTRLDVAMQVAMEKQKINVDDDTGGVGTDPTANVGALVLRGADLDSLSDDPDQLASDLQALAGPGAGPNGGQIFIDGFTGGRLPPKSSIREIRINQNPFSAEFDRLGFGRIEIFTKPGTDRFRGQLMSVFSDNAFNARNPFVNDKPAFRSAMLMGTLSGPVTKKSSFSFDIERRAVDESAVINATILDASLLPVSYRDSIRSPQTRWNIIPRYDWQAGAKNSLTVRYAFSKVTDENRGVGEFALPSRAFNMFDTEHTLQLTNTYIRNATTINETRFQFMRGSQRQDGDGSLPAINVLDAFNGGGPQVGLSRSETDRYEWNNVTSVVKGAHTWKFGGRARLANLDDLSPQNFGGTYTFAGGTAPLLDASNRIVLGADGSPVMTRIDSLERYRRTELFLRQGLTGAQIRALGGGASQFSIAGGNPLATVSQVDAGLFLLDDWRARPNLTLSYGLRYEVQNNISDWRNLAPRLSLAWGVDGGAGRATKTVLRAGFGAFYDRVSENLTLQALRFNGVNQRQYIVSNPDFYPNAPAIAALEASRVPQAIRELDLSLRAPYIMQTAISVDRQLPRNTSASVTYTFSRGVHMLRTRNVNAPLDGVRPLAGLGDLFLFESTGTMRQNQIITNVNTRFSKYVSLFGFYMLNHARGDTDGVASFPANSYDLSSEWGPTRFDVRHRVFLGGAVTLPKGLSLNPFVTASSGQPFNIVLGRDTNGDSVFLERPAFATNGNAPGVVATEWGVFNLNPGPGDTIIPRNYGRGPAQFTVNLRLGKTWGFGNRGETGPGDDWRPPSMRTGGGPGGPGGPGGGPPGGGPGGGGGAVRMMMGGDTGKRYNITLSVSARNLLNYVNLAAPVGNLSSPLFGESTALSGGFAGAGSPMAASAASNRRIDLMLRFTF